MSAVGLTMAMAVLAAGPTTRPIRQPTTRPGAGFTITGRLTPPERVKRVRLIDREDPANAATRQARVFTAAFDRTTGRFVAEGLPRGYYDLMIETPEGRIDGVNLRDIPDPLDLAPARPPAGPITGKDVQWINDFVLKMRMFENRKRVLYVNGDAGRAKALVEKIRDEPTTLPSAAPQVFWRMEVWEFRKQYGGWVRTKWMVLYRDRLAAAEFRARNWMFEPDLGGLPAQPAYVTDIGDYAMPARFDPAKGLAAQ